MLASCLMIKSKGVREYQRMINYFLIIDRIRGASYGELAKRYKLDKSNISKRVRGVLNATKVKN
jgi:Mor family transcriptional regulator